MQFPKHSKCTRARVCPSAKPPYGEPVEEVPCAVLARACFSPKPPCAEPVEGALDASLSGLGWCMNPAMLIGNHLASGRLVELLPGTPLDVPLFWQINRLAADRLADLTRAVVDTAKLHLVR